MIGDDQNQQVPSRRPEYDPAVASRLVKRGLEILDSSGLICLDIVDLVVCESSIVVLASGWDRDALRGDERDETYEVNDSWSSRSVIAYEFDVNGEYQGKLMFQLVQFRRRDIRQLLSALRVPYG